MCRFLRWLDRKFSSARVAAAQSSVLLVARSYGQNASTTSTIATAQHRWISAAIATSRRP